MTAHDFGWDQLSLSAGLLNFVQAPAQFFSPTPGQPGPQGTDVLPWVWPARYHFEFINQGTVTGSTSTCSTTEPVFFGRGHLCALVACRSCYGLSEAGLRGSAREAGRGGAPRRCRPCGVRGGAALGASGIAARQVV